MRASWSSSSDTLRCRSVASARRGPRSSRRSTLSFEALCAFSVGSSPSDQKCFAHSRPLLTDTTPLGAIQNRFLGDISNIEITLAETVGFTLLEASSICGELYHTFSFEIKLTKCYTSFHCGHRCLGAARPRRRRTSGVGLPTDPKRVPSHLARSKSDCCLAAWTRTFVLPG